MPEDLLEQLARHEVPARPVNLRRQVHQRLNPRLLALHLAEFATRAFPYAMFYFFKALTGATVFSLTGRFPNEGDDHANRNESSQ